MIKSESITGLIKDLIQAQKTMPHADEDKANPHFRSKFAGLQSLQKASKRHLAKHNLVITQLASTSDDGNPEMTTLLMHTSGEFLGASLSCKADKPGAQALGSTSTYLQGLGLRTIAQIVLGGEDEIPDEPEVVSDQHDDDGESATNHQTDAAIEKAIAECKKVGMTESMVDAFFETHGDLPHDAMLNELRSVHARLRKRPKKSGMTRPESTDGKEKVSNDGPIFN